jgi:hypothetical protein
MKIQELKLRAKEVWRDLNTVDKSVCVDSQFKSDVRQVGDLRRKATWETAIARWMAKLFYDCCLDSSSLVLYSFNFKQEEWYYPLRHQIVDEFLKYPDGRQLILDGLEQLFGINTEENFDELLGLLQEQPHASRSLAGSAI